MSAHYVKEVKSIRPSLKKYPASHEPAPGGNSKQTAASYLHERSGIALLIAVIISLLVLPHLSLSTVETATAPVQQVQTQPEYKIVQAKPGDSAWSLLQAVNSPHIDMDQALDKFRILNGSIQIKAGYSYKIPVMH